MNINKKGFTLIELLIVIALLGILAIGLLAAIDPFEQLKKGRDTGTRNTVEEFYNSVLRYYAINGKFPWTSVAQPAENLIDYTDSHIQAIVDAGELKSLFIDRATQNRLNRIFVTSTHIDPATGFMDDLAVCFVPESKAFRSDENTAYDIDGSTLGLCPTNDIGVETCYWCIK